MRKTFRSTIALSVAFFAVAGNAAPTPATLPAEPDLSSRAQQVADLFVAQPGGYDKIFTDEFRKAVSDERFGKITKDIFSAAGRCVAVKPAGALQATRGQFTFVFENGSSATVHLVIESASPHRVSGFFISPLEATAKSYDDVIAQLKKLPGVTSLYAAEIAGTELKPLAQLNAGKPLALGSAFKLYVLAELVREIEAGDRHWDDVVHLTARSLPSGFLQSWPAGSPITLHTLASAMISQSDNTATDQLIAVLGREKIEAMLATAGHSNPKLNQPFLSTVEMFKLKGDPARKAADEYAGDLVDARRAMLGGPIARMPVEKIQFPDTPTHIDDIEWFATTADMTRVMLWLKSHSEKSPATEARAILAINPGLRFSKQRWPYVGYKGGSEPGVLNMTYLLENNDKSGRWFAVSMTWNNPAKALDEAVFFSIVQQAVELAGRDPMAR